MTSFHYRYGWVFIALSTLVAVATAAEPPAKPNVLWIIAEDACKDFGCYGTAAARTPNIDRFAAESCRYQHAFATAPVCSPSRSALITGLYQTRIGAQNHRSHRTAEFVRPPEVRLITERLREAGYFTANVRKLPAELGFNGAGKTDWNFYDDGKAFDSADWGDLKAHQPFYAQVDLHETHRVYYRATKNPTDPAKVTLPPYLADDPLIRADWAAYLDEVAVLDQKVGALLELLDREGLRDNTVVFFLADHGREDFRGKYFAYEQGFEAPLIVRWPSLLKPGSTSDDLVSFLDIHAQTLAMAGVNAPGLDGAPFFGPGARKREYIYGARDRIDDTPDRVRTVRDARFKYLHNFEPQRPYLQRMAYAEVTNPAYNRMRQLFAEGRLNADQAKFMAPSRPPEELYDLQADPFELHNLADDPAQRVNLERLRKQCDAWMADTHDQGAIPEDPAAVAADLQRNEAPEKKLRATLGLGPHEVLLKVPPMPTP
ncbi:MAG: sulfatase [Chthoniobacter sp.]|uniref:sulfatase family protein n=1 Tax=Chthoniobacter sp. TaxID=2510640 RepID=UPI0032A70D2F